MEYKEQKLKEDIQSLEHQIEDIDIFDAETEGKVIARAIGMLYEKLEHLRWSFQDFHKDFLIEMKEMRKNQ